MTVYYATTEKLEEWITSDLNIVPLYEIVKEAERLVRLEFAAAKSYREKPELLYNSHPWMRFVRHPDYPAVCHGYPEEWEERMATSARRPRMGTKRGVVVVGERGPEYALRVMDGSVVARFRTPDEPPDVLGVEKIRKVS